MAPFQAASTTPSSTPTRCSGGNTTRGACSLSLWQQGRTQNLVDNAPFDGPGDLHDMFTAHPNNTFLVKLSYWINP